MLVLWGKGRPQDLRVWIGLRRVPFWILTPSHLALISYNWFGRFVWNESKEGGSLVVTCLETCWSRCQRGLYIQFQFTTVYGCVWKWLVPLNPMVNDHYPYWMAIIGNIPYFQTNPYVETLGFGPFPNLVANGPVAATPSWALDQGKHQAYWHLFENHS